MTVRCQRSLGRRVAIGVSLLLLEANGTDAAESNHATACSSTTAPAGRVYSADEVSARFAKPADLSGLLRNLKVAMDENLLLQPAFYDARILAKFFGGARVGSEEPQPSQLIGEWQGITSITGTAAFGILTATLKRTCGAVRGPGDLPRTRLAGAATIEVGGLLDLTVARVRSTLGKEASSFSDNYRNVPRTKGRLVYVRPGSLITGAMPGTSQLTFIASLDSPPPPADAPVGELFYDTDLMERIEIFQVEH